MNRALDQTLAALADPHRRAAIDLLKQCPRASGDLARALGLTAPAMSRQLRVLRECGLVEETHSQFDARVRVYSLRPQPMIDLMRWLEETERLWMVQLADFKAHVEGASDASVVDA